jgi:phosphate transport system permease protein
MRSSDLDVVGRPAVGPGLLATALATVLVVAMLGLLLWIVGVNALRWFWPAPVWQLTLSDGQVLVGEVVDRRRLAAEAKQPDEHRVLVKIGNREATGRDHVWIRESEVEHIERPASVVRINRATHGAAYGWIRRVVDLQERTHEPPQGAMLEGLLAEAAALRERAVELRRTSDRVRRPLTRLEHRAARLRRSDHGRTPEGRREAEVLAGEISRESARLGPELDRYRVEREAIEDRLERAGLAVAADGVEIVVPLAEIIEVQWPNTLSPGRRMALAARNFGRFLVDEPREANTEGGIFPALFGTVLMVLLMSLAVMPLGVLTAVYMTEYASEGIGLTIAHHAVNNLAGIPSIVIGIFGLTFFVYGIGGGLDRLFFSDALPTPTFGTGGILWASLTLALLTVPVVVVATREGLLAVPKGWKEGALALGATKWQTLKRIVLPAALPGILTGLILAVGRAVGEVAPLMLTGAVKLAPSLPVDTTAPFFHLERKFMHLGFHIYDVSMQSPNIEAAKPMAFATTLVLVVLVLAINLAAIVARRRLRLAYRVTEI